MPANTLQIPSYTNEAARLNVLLDDLIISYKTGAVSSREELLQEWNAVVARFQSSVGSMVLEYRKVQPDTVPLVSHHNDQFSNLGRDVQILFIKLQALGTLVSALLTQTLTEADVLNSDVRRIASKITDLSMYSGETGFLASETFINTSGLEINSSLLSGAQCELLSDEGAISLHFSNRELVKIRDASLDLNTFNGVIGNNEQGGLQSLRNDIRAITDGNQDTWVEFEKTYFDDQLSSVKPLVVDILLRLEEESIVNRITIDPINFGILSGVEVEDISVLDSGGVWKSLKNDFPLAPYNGETQDSVFEIGTQSSLYNGKFSFTFLPRKTKLVSVKLRQADTYKFISSTNIGKNRQAIGIRSIDLYRISFDNKSEIISASIQSSLDIDKVFLLSAYRPTNSSLGKVSFFVSVDNGLTWKAIHPAPEDTFATSEILELFSGARSFRWKILIERNDAAFSQTPSLEEQVNFKQQIETISTISGISPLRFSLVEKPSSPLITIIDVLGCRGYSFPPD